MGMKSHLNTYNTLIILALSCQNKTEYFYFDMYMGIYLLGMKLCPTQITKIYLFNDAKM